MIMLDYSTEAAQMELMQLMGAKYWDEYIPLPDMSPVEQKEAHANCTKDHDSMQDAIYWENQKGAHGWCCSECGEVLQWG